MSSFLPPKKVLEKWAYTRKAKKKLGDTFVHPRLFSTVESKTDTALFILAILIEIGVGFLAMSMRGFDIVVVSAATGLLIIDLILAYQLHARKQNNICKENCEIEKLRYRRKFNLYEYGENDAKIEALRAGVARLKQRQVKYKVGIVISAVLKIFGFWLINYYGLAIFAFVTVLYAFAAYIHIAHTGYCIFYWSFRNDYKREKGKFLRELHDEAHDGQFKSFDDPIEDQKIPEIVKTDLLEKANSLRQANTDEPFIIFGSKAEHEHKILCKIIQNGAEIKHKYILRRCGLIEDDEWFDLINNGGMTTPVKSFMGYLGLVKQYDGLEYIHGDAE
jgi:hypothetical protein